MDILNIYEALLLEAFLFYSNCIALNSFAIQVTYVEGKSEENLVHPTESF